MNTQLWKKILYGILPVALFGLLTGYILWYKIFEYPPHRYNLDFNGAMWISTGKQTPHGYFVKEIYIPEMVTDAWITLAATDNVTLFINGIEIASDTFVSLNVSAIHSVSDKIQQGKNTIAVYVRRSSFPGSARLLLKGMYYDISGKEHVFVTDKKWKVSSVEETQGNYISWSNKNFDHSGWNDAVVEGESSAFTVNASPTSPSILGKVLSGYWIWHPHQGIRSAYFMKSFTIDAPIKDAIIGIAGSSIYEVTVNGKAVAKGVTYEKKLDIYTITPLLRSGNNTVGIGVKAQDTVPGLFVDGYVIKNDDLIVPIKSDSTWRTISNITSEQHIPDVNSKEWMHPLLLEKYPAQPWGVLIKRVKNIEVPLSYTMQRTIKFILFISSIIVVMVSLWLLISYLHAKVKKDDIGNSLVGDGFLHIPPLLFLFFICLLQFDARNDLSFPFQYKFVLVSLSVLFLLRGAFFTGIPARNWRPKILGEGSRKTLSVLFVIFLICLIAIGLMIRLHELDYTSLSHDEISIMQYTGGLLNKGYPHKVIGTYIKQITTYELLPFSIFIPVIIGGFHDFAGRLHSVFWGTLEILIIYLLGKTLFNRMVGIMAASVYIFHPWCIIWSQNLYYPQLTQVLSTLTVLFFYKAIDEPYLNKKYLYLTSIFFSLMYLSWEGSGFLLVSLFLALIVHKGSNLTWIKNKHFWTSFAIVFLTVFIQQSRRILLQDPYLIVGSSIGDISLPTLFFLDPMYNPYFYINNFLFIDNNAILTVFMIAGIPLLFKCRQIRYLYVILFVTLFFMTNFIQIAANRYSYYLQPFLILIACSVSFLYIDALKKTLAREFLGTRIVSSVSLVSMFLILFIASNNIFCKFYLISKNPSNPTTLTRQNVYWNDYKSTGRYVKENVKSGDIAFVMMPHTLMHYAGRRGDYSLSTILSRGYIYDASEHYSGFIDKYMGNKVVTSFDEFKDIVAKNNRVWFISAPDTSLTGTNDDLTVDYIKKNFKVVYETYNAKIYLREK